MPPAPKATASTSFGIGREVKTTSACATSSAMLPAALAPASVQRATAAAPRSKTITS
jgi:hypothetical protein